MPISAITPDEIGSRVYVKGEVSDLRETLDGHLIFKLNDDIGSITIFAFEDLAKDLSCVENGRAIEVRGTVDEYRDVIEIIPLKATDVTC
jgi:DNA/RNA endonuclease YhcR with UshA esterase domain